MKKMVLIGIMATMIAFGNTGCATPKAVKEDVTNTAKAAKELAVDAVTTAKDAATTAAEAVSDTVEKVMPKKLDLDGKSLWKKGGDIKGL